MKYWLKSPSSDERQKYSVFSVRALSRRWLVHARLCLRFLQPIATAMELFDTSLCLTPAGLARKLAPGDLVSPARRP
ncbi:MAG: hypothetical protein WBM63_19690, partial [Sedimenticolaceae bacterium]